MNVNIKCSSFQSIILELIGQKLNMMLTEIFQLSKSVDANDFEKLTKIILKEIANCHIASCHMTSANAKKTIQILDQMDTHQEIKLNFKNDRRKKQRSPFSDLPFS